MVGLLATLELIFVGLRTRRRRILAWAWLLSWLLLSGLLTAVLTFFADPVGVERHVLFSLVLLRLLMWLGLLVLIDLAATQQTAAAVG